MQDNSKEAKNKRYAWLLEHNNDYVSSCTYDTIEECIEDAKRDFKDYTSNYNQTYSITVQELVPYDIQIDGEIILDDLWSQVEEDVGDAADDWLNSDSDYTTEQLNDLSERLTRVVKTWLKETNNEPPFFRILSEKEIQICDIPQ